MLFTGSTKLSLVTTERVLGMIKGVKISKNSFNRGAERVANWAKSHIFEISGTNFFI